MKKAQELYKCTDKLYKINEMQMHKQIVYISELKGELYNYNIQFPKVEKT